MIRTTGSIIKIGILTLLWCFLILSVKGQPLLTPVNEVPAGLVNGTNAVFTTGFTPYTLAPFQLYRNGLLQASCSLAPTTCGYTLQGNTITLNTALQTNEALQVLYFTQGAAYLACVSASGSQSAYTCSPSPAWTAYVPNTVFYWTPDVNGTAAPMSLNVSGLGQLPLRMMDGTLPTGADVRAGRTYPLLVTATAFVFLQPVMTFGTYAGAPTCSQNNRGKPWLQFQPLGMADHLFICAQLATGFSWVQVF